MQEASPSVQRAYINGYANLESAIYDEWPGASVFDAESIMQALSASLHRYRREPGEGFTAWALAWVKRQARRYRFMAEIRAELPRLIYAAAERAMFCCPAEDDAVDVTDAEQALYLYLLTKPREIDSLMRPGTAKTSTRIFRLVKESERNRRKLMTDRLHKTIKRCAGQEVPEDENNLVAA